jgi:von Willebrand factor type A domain
MDLTFLTPLASIFAVSVLLPLVVFRLRARRVGRIRAALRLDPQGLGSRLPLLMAVAAVSVLLGIAAAQPVLGRERSIPERADAQAFFVLDTSRSMLAAAGPGAPTRFERAQRVASALRDRIPQVPVGLVSMTDRILPHAFPTTDRRVFEATLHRSIGVEQPPPAFTYSTYATSYDVLAGIPERHYFPKQAKKRVLVVFTDGESRPLGADLARAFDVKPRIKTVFVRFWRSSERIYETGVTEGGYLPDRQSAATLERAASLVGGRVFSEQQVATAGDEIARIVGRGQTRKRTIAGARLALMPYVTLLAFLPLTFVLWRRNR